MEPDEFFIAEPDDQLLIDNGINLCGCVPRRCRVFSISGSVDYSDFANIQSALLLAYLEANPSLTEAQVAVDVSDLNPTTNSNG